jgi:hypothetical protein
VVGAIGAERIAKVLAALFPQALLAVTVMVPVVKVLLTLSVTAVVPCPDAIEVPNGATQV